MRGLRPFDPGISINEKLEIKMKIRNKNQE